MVLETQLRPLLEWLREGVPSYLLVLLVLAAVGLAFSFLTAMLRYGPTQALKKVSTGFVEGLVDLIHTSPRRVLAMSSLAFKESIRRKVLVSFALFLIILLFAGWFLDTSGDRPAEVFLTFVMTATSYLVLVLALILSAFSLPTDIRDRTIFTVVSKPVRRNEIVLGRILGFTMTGTVMLVGMGVVSYLFVLRGLDHTHRLVETDLKAVQPTSRNPLVKQGRTAMSHGHWHEVRIYEDGTAETDNAQGHWHEVMVEKNGDQTRYLVGPPQGTLAARQVMYGTLKFFDRSGNVAQQKKRDGTIVNSGVNVGNEWDYRSFIEGGTNASAAWRFTGLTEDLLAGRDSLPIELTLSVFRTHKGIINQGVLGSIMLRNPYNGRTSERELFTAREYYTDVHLIPRKLRDAQLKDIDLFQDLVHNGELEVVIACEHPGQYFGMAQYDLYIRANDKPFWQNFVKGYLGIWLRMVLVIGMGVMFSTFLRGAVAMLSTLAAILGGFFTQYIYQLAFSHRGPLDAMMRILMHQGEVQDLDDGLYKTFTQMVDGIFNSFLQVVVTLLPDFRIYSNADFVASGFDVPLWTAPGLIYQFLTALAYLIPMFITAHYALRSKEVAQ